MASLLESPFGAPTTESPQDDFFGGYQGPANSEPQPTMPGFFDAELLDLKNVMSSLGARATDLAFRAPATVFGWFFESERPWWPRT